LPLNTSTTPALLCPDRCPRAELSSVEEFSCWAYGDRFCTVCLLPRKEWSSALDALKSHFLAIKDFHEAKVRRLIRASAESRLLEVILGEEANDGDGGHQHELAESLRTFLGCERAHDWPERVVHVFSP
jgi:hypothetical protein